VVVIEKISSILKDDYGFDFIELSLSDGTKGIYPNKVDFLYPFKKGDVVSYIKLKNIGDKNVYVYLKKIIQMNINKIRDISQINMSKGKFYADITLDDGNTAKFLTESYQEISALKKGSVVEYDSINDLGDKGSIFVNLFKTKVDYENQKNKKIAKQVALKAAVEMLKIASPKGRYSLQDGVDSDSMVKDLLEVTKKIEKYILDTDD
jgi:hypothetical protein